jgi:hypothetical protein
MRISFLSCGAAALGSCPKTGVEEATSAIQKEAARKVTKIPLYLFYQTGVPPCLFPEPVGQALRLPTNLSQVQAASDPV